MNCDESTAMIVNYEQRLKNKKCMFKLEERNIEHTMILELTLKRL